MASVFNWIIRISSTWTGTRKRAVPHSVPLSSGAGGGTRRQTCLSVSEQRQFDGQLNDDYRIEVLVYRKSLLIADIP